MGSLEDVSIASEGLATLILAVLTLLRQRQGTLLALGLLWLSLALFDFSLLLLPSWETWRDGGSYFLFITAMLWLATSRWRRPHHPAQRVSQ
jgi:hypothetical protein